MAETDKPLSKRQRAAKAKAARKARAAERKADGVVSDGLSPEQRRAQRAKDRVAAVMDNGGVTTSKGDRYEHAQTAKKPVSGSMDDKIAVRKGYKITKGEGDAPDTLTIVSFDRAEVTDVSEVPMKVAGQVLSVKSFVVIGDQAFLVEDTADNIIAAADPQLPEGMEGPLLPSQPVVIKMKVTPATAQKYIERVPGYEPPEAEAPTEAESPVVETPEAANDDSLTVTFYKAHKPDKYPGELKIPAGADVTLTDVTDTYTNPLLSGKLTLVQAGEDFYVAAKAIRGVANKVALDGATIDAVELNADEAAELQTPAAE